MTPSRTFRTAVAAPLVIAASFLPGKAMAEDTASTGRSKKADIVVREENAPRNSGVAALSNASVPSRPVLNDAEAKQAQEIAAFKITTPAEARKFAEKYLVKSPSDIDIGFEARMKMLVDVVPFEEGSTAYAPKLFVQRLFNLYQGGMLSGDNVKLYLNYKDAPDAYGSVTDLRQRCRKYEDSKESMSHEAKAAALKEIRIRAETDVTNFSNKSKIVASKAN